MREQYAYIVMPDMTITPALQQFFDRLLARHGVSWTMGFPTLPHNGTYTWGCPIEGDDYILLHNLVLAGELVSYKIEASLPWYVKEYGDANTAASI